MPVLVRSALLICPAGTQGVVALCLALTACLAFSPAASETFLPVQAFLSSAILALFGMLPKDTRVYELLQQLLPLAPG